jgi:hypothetical protein
LKPPASEQPTGSTAPNELTPSRRLNERVSFYVWTAVALATAVTVVLGSYVGAQYMRVWRPRRRGQQAATRAVQAPELPADLAAGRPLGAVLALRER